MIPLISTLCQGPLGVAQMPRFWWKNLLYCSGHLDHEYPANSGGLDQWMVDLLGLDMDRTQAFLHDETPDYLRFEAWVVEHGVVQKAALERWNSALMQRPHVIPAKIAETYADIGYAPTTTVEVSAVMLNSLQDWQLFYLHDLEGNGLESAVVPLLSSTDRGPLGICQLPRTWLKVCLRARAMLHEEYPDCAEGSLDQQCLQALKVDEARALGFLRNNMPTYLEFEEWLRLEGCVEAAAVEAFNYRLLRRQHVASKLEDIHALLERPNDGTWTSGVLLNHLEDWHFAHRMLTVPN